MKYVETVHRVKMTQVSVVIAHTIGGFTGTTEFLVHVHDPLMFKKELENTLRTEWSLLAQVRLPNR